MEAYTNRNWASPNPNEIEQCKHKSSSESLNRGEGCLIVGELLTKKIPATITFELTSVGKNIMSNWAFQITGEHTVNHIGFSDPDGKVLPGPMDGKTLQSFVTLYYLKVTSAIKDDVRFYETSNTFLQVNEHSYPLVAIYYDIDPITTLYKNEKTFSEFLVSICAIIGGSSAMLFVVSKVIIK